MSEKQQSQEVARRLRVTSDRVGVPQYVVMARALELFDEEIAELVTAHVEKFSPPNVTPRPNAKATGAPAVRGSRQLTSGQKAARTRKRNAAGRKAAKTRLRNGKESVSAMVGRLSRELPGATFTEIVGLAVKKGAKKSTAAGALVRYKASVKSKPASKKKRCEFCSKLFAPQGLARHLSPLSKVDCALKFRKQKRSK